MRAEKKDAVLSLREIASEQYQTMVLRMIAGGNSAREMQATAERHTKGRAHDYVSAGDMAAQDAIRRALEIHFPSEPIQDEEQTDANFAGDGWIIDPIDGTMSYINQQHLWCTAMVRVQGGVPTMSAVYAPAHGVDGTLYYVEGGCLYVNGQQVTNEELSLDEGPTFYLGTNASKRLARSAGHPLRSVADFLNANSVRTVTYPSTSLMGADMASAPVSPGILMALDQAIWDMMPSMAMVRAGGGVVMVQGEIDWSGKQANTFLLARGDQAFQLVNQIEGLQELGFKDPYESVTS